MQLIDHLHWRYATKRFDAGRKVRPETLDQLKEVVRLSASSYGLQPYHILVVEDPVLRDQLGNASTNKASITESSHLFVFCSYRNISPEQIDAYLDLRANVQKADPVRLKAYGEKVKLKLASKSESEVSSWTAKQTYIALGNLLAGCAELKIDACPIEGFDTEQYDKILGLEEKGLTATVVAAIGYRSPEDASQFAPKVRKPVGELFETV